MEKIKDTIFKFLRLDGLIDAISGYVETRVELLKLEIREEVAKIVSRGVILAVVLLVGLLFLIFVSIAVAQYINSFYNNAYTGFGIVAAFYGLIFALIIIFRKTIDLRFEKKIIESLKRKSK